jgi:hypothetical protein
MTVVISPYTQKRDDPNRKGQMTMRFRGQYTIVDPQKGPVFPSLFWRPEFGGLTSIFDKSVSTSHNTRSRGIK